jgi:D-alanyl-D-alanine carboxypeptidase
MRFVNFIFRHVRLLSAQIGARLPIFAQFYHRFSAAPVMGQSPRWARIVPGVLVATPVLSELNRRLHEDLGIPPSYGNDGVPPYYAEIDDLVDVGPNLVGRMQQLEPDAAGRWQRMVEAAGTDGVRLLIVSGFRSAEYQAELIRRKLETGDAIDDILKVVAAPGFSQHHTGRAVDIATPGSRPLTEEFEDSDAFAWLTKNAEKHGFSMTYPRDNAHGFIYEPWHWALNGKI